MLRRLYEKTLELSGHKKALPILAGVSFAESSFFPIPPDIMLMPMVLAQRHRAWLIATVCTVASVLGGAAGYLIGFTLWDQIGVPMMEFYGYADKLAEFSESYNDKGGLIVFTFGLTIFPYKVITIASGATALNFGTFILASASSRGIRFFLETWLLWQFGEQIKTIIDKYFGLITMGLAIILVGAFLAYRYFTGT